MFSDVRDFRENLLGEDHNLFKHIIKFSLISYTFIIQTEENSK